jgi:hypothetical protein
MIFKKRKKNGKKGIKFFLYLKNTISSGSTYELLLIYKLQQSFHVEPLLYLTL